MNGIPLPGLSLAISGVIALPIHFSAIYFPWRRAHTGGGPSSGRDKEKSPALLRGAYLWKQCNPGRRVKKQILIVTQKAYET